METDRVLYTCRLCEEPVGFESRAFCIACEPLVQHIKDPVAKRVIETLIVKVAALRSQLSTRSSVGVER